MKIIQVGDYVCKVGESAQENWDLVDGAKKHHFFFHLTDFPSPYVVLECDKGEPNAHIQERCSEICVEHSKQRSAGKVKVDATPCGNVKVDRRDVTGECDYKNEGKVEVIVVQTKKKKGKGDGNDEQDEPERGKMAGERLGKNSTKEKGRDADAVKGAAGPKKLVEPAVAIGKHVTVRKSAGGWATVTFSDATVRSALLRETEEIAVRSGVTVKLQPQIDQKTKEEVPTELFVSWGRKAEERTPVSEAELLRCFDELARRSAMAVERAAPKRSSGDLVSVRKAAAGGCAVISFVEPCLRNKVLGFFGREAALESGIVIKLQPQVDPKSKEEVPTDAFAAWGRKVEEKTPVSEAELLRFFEGAAARVAAGEGPAAAAAPEGDLARQAMEGTSTLTGD
mmetsp:Transcript_18550/g.50918  ORF Transcript_18550/g.50918 Transcript_18550/m.50918 type:complete len:396 (-) Transcript_18550:36-1223(-)|eukprot:CAMPEP_0117524152 /NCGR_PEP_ID=MMETSP0784-20121206/35099_1 /TAXON_ID=39447 /ORGANISM="" /LENGTH=395 /DNA_ID=CAMNT_0005320293 /DNA_START=252 /DNA_END=1439 /DNA_ORIENTATION=+